jgi:phosphatidylethanolamine/phosphatidyl-N-methylethanolamine N-methyltransferase
MSKRLFLKQLISNPRGIGAACPSSQKLAHHMAACVPYRFEGNIIELGPGTGVVTDALLKRGIPAHRIVAVEYSADLIKHLRQKFPDVMCVHGDAAHLSTLLRENAGFNSTSKVEVVVSSLPFKSLPTAIVKAIAHELDSILSESGRIIQFSYDLRKNSPNPFHHFQNRHSKIIWQNIPPARVTVFERKHALAGKH